MFQVDSKSYPTSINTIMLCTVLTHVGEYTWTIHKLTPSTFTTPSNETMGVFHIFHPHGKVDLPLSVNDFRLRMKVTIDQKAFVFALTRSPHLSSNGALNMVYKILWKLTILVCLTIICTPIPIVFFSGFPTCGFHSHFVEVKYTTRGPIGRNVVCFGSPSHFSPYSNNPPYLCFPFLGEWYT